MKPRQRDRLAKAIVRAGGSRKISSGVRVAAAVLAEIAAIVREEDRLELRGFGVFYLQRLPKQKRHNPKTGANVEVPSRWKVSFRAGKLLRGRETDQ